jgi:arginine N-succinyltransferase
MVHFINLPPDSDIILQKIRNSRAAFARARGAEPGSNGAVDAAPSRPRSGAGASPNYMFVIEDSDTGNPVGSSAIISEMGSPGNPNIKFRLRRRSMFSEDLQAGATHVTAKLVLDEDGPTEIGGLILGPSYRGHRQKLGKQLSLVRFHYIGLHRDCFKDRMLAEMMAPITPDGGNTLWEYLGRRFINLSYEEADRFCAQSREFMTSLLPREEIYLTLLPPEARALIGRVGPDTEPARAMLERLGFSYRDHIDPFDGGPHLEAETDDIPLINQTRRVTLAGACPVKEADSLGFASFEDGETGVEFRAVQTPMRLSNTEVRLPRSAIKAIGADEGAVIGVTSLETPDSAPAPKRRSATSRSKAAA